MATKTDEPKRITLDIPQREGKEGYIGTMLTLFLQLGRTFTDNEFKETNINIIYHMNFMISMIPEEEDRKKIRSELNKEIENRTNEAIELSKQSGNVLDNDDKARIRNMVYIEYIGKVMDWVDKFVGISTKNKVGFVRRKRNE